METFLTPEQVAEQLSVETTTVYSWLKTARLAGVKLGRLWRVRAVDLKKFTEKGWNIEKTPPPFKAQHTNNGKESPKTSSIQQTTAWIDSLPQIDLSATFAPNTIFCREEIYNDEASEQRLYGATVKNSVKGTKGAKK